MDVKIKAAKPITGEFTVPSDKSLSHRAVIFGSLASGVSRVKNFLFSEDCISSINCMRALGVNIRQEKNNDLIISAGGGTGLKEPGDVLDAGNSGTTIRILSGVLASCNFYSVITGDESLRRRPMKRIIEPLTLMGAQIMGRRNGTLPPLSIKGGKLGAIKYNLSVASAQVKSCILAAALFADGVTEITEPTSSRNHTELMLKTLGADIDVSKNTIKIQGGKQLKPFDTWIPGDISSAAFIIAAAVAVPGSVVLIKGVGLNPTRTGIIEALRKMGAYIKVMNEKENGTGELYGDIEVRHSCLTGVNVCLLYTSPSPRDS